jgi:hypothetical protein
MTTGLRLAVAGLRFRRSTAVIVLVLATVASAAAVLAPLYARAAEESILRSTLRHTDTFTLGVQLSVPDAGTGEARGDARDGRAMVARTRQVLRHPAFAAPQLSYAGSGSYAPVAGSFRGGEVTGQVVERADLCRHLELTSGRCPRTQDEALLTGRSLRLVGGRLGSTLPLALGGASSVAVPLRVVGTFDPPAVDDTYWAGRPYFASYYPAATPHGLDELPPSADPAFVGAGTAAAAGITRYTIDVPVLPDRVRLDDVATLRAELEALRAAAQDAALTLDSKLPAALAGADDGRRLVRVAAPLAVSQLVLLSWWALFLVVGSATEERSPELGLAKLRGLTGSQTTRFGLAEVLLLLLLAAPVGTVLGYAAVRLAAPHVFAPGTSVVVTWSVLLTVLGALAGGLVTAVLSSRQVFRRPVTELLRRVPSRSAGRRAGVVEAVVVVLTVLGVVQLRLERGGSPSPVALLAPGMVAVAGGLLAARVLVRVARRSSATALGKGRPATGAGWAGIARRPGTARIASVLAVATCLLLVGVESWSVAARNRAERAAVETGAAVVLHVRASEPQVLLATVRSADPRGTYAMAAMQVEASNQDPSMLAIDADRADRVVLWGHEHHPRLRPVLHPDLPPSLDLRPGRLLVTVDLAEVSSPSPLQLSARLDLAGVPARVELGRLQHGTRTYTARLPGGCRAGGCRLAALGVDHPAVDLAAATATLRVLAVQLNAADGQVTELGTDLGRPGSWRPGSPTLGGPVVDLQPAGAALQVTLQAPGGPTAKIVRGDAPDPLPATVGREAVPDGGGPGRTAGPAGPVRYAADATVDYLPRLGAAGVLTDLELALRQPTGGGAGEPQVWLARDDPAAERALTARLKAAGIPVVTRESRAALAREYAGNGAVLALRLLLVSGGAAVLVALGALLVAAYIGRRQRAYEVAALRVVGVRARTARTLLLVESVGTVLVATVCGAVAAAVATAAVLPALPQFDAAAAYVPVRYAPDLPAGAATLLALILILLAAGSAVAALQLRSGRPERLREGVR